MKKIIATILTILGMAAAAYACDPVPRLPQQGKYVLVSVVDGRSGFSVPLEKTECENLRDATIAIYKANKLFPPVPSQVEKQVTCVPLWVQEPL